MPSRYQYHQSVRERAPLGVSKVIRAMTAGGKLNWLVEATNYGKWADREARERQQRQKESERQATNGHAEGLKEAGLSKSRAAQEHLEVIRKVLVSRLGLNLASTGNHSLIGVAAPFPRSTSPDPTETRFACDSFGS